MALCAPRKGLREKDKVWLLREQKRKKKLRKLLRRLQNNDTCSMPGLTCFTHDNRHWQTAPLWTREPAARAGGRTRGCIRGHPAGWGGAHTQPAPSRPGAAGVAGPSPGAHSLPPQWGPSAPAPAQTTTRTGA